MLKLLLMIIIFSLSFVSLVSSQEDPTESAEFKKFYSENKFKEAWNVIKDVNELNNYNLFFTKGIFLGSNVLTNGRKRCEAVSKLEVIEESGGIYARTSLNHLYEGDWISVASLEGNRVALYLKALRQIEAHNPILFLENKKGLKSNIVLAIMLLKDSLALGYAKSEAKLHQLEQEHPQIYRQVISGDGALFFQPKRIFCNVRVY